MREGEREDGKDKEGEEEKKKRSSGNGIKGRYEYMRAEKPYKLN